MGGESISVQAYLITAAGSILTTNMAIISVHLAGQDSHELILQAKMVMSSSCRPNAAVSFTGPLLTVRALQPLDSLEDALITYVDPDLPGPVRW